MTVFLFVTCYLISRLVVYLESNRIPTGSFLLAATVLRWWALDMARAWALVMRQPIFVNCSSHGVYFRPIELFLLGCFLVYMKLKSEWWQHLIFMHPLCDVFEPLFFISLSDLTAHLRPLRWWVFSVYPTLPFIRHLLALSWSFPNLKLVDRLHPIHGRRQHQD